MGVQCSWASHASPSSEGIKLKEWKSEHFQLFWASHASHSTEKIHGCGMGVRSRKAREVGNTRIVERNRAHEVDPLEGTSSQKNIHRFFPRAAQGPHKVRTRSTLAGSSRRPIWAKFGRECRRNMEWEGWKPRVIENVWISMLLS